jgi:hypothetical protein
LAKRLLKSGAKIGKPRLSAVDWAGPADIKREIRSANILKDGRVV